jgi:hypothetical protein
MSCCNHLTTNNAVTTHGYNLGWLKDLRRITAVNANDIPFRLLKQLKCALLPVQFRLRLDNKSKDRELQHNKTESCGGPRKASVVHYGITMKGLCWRQAITRATPYYSTQQNTTHTAPAPAPSPSTAPAHAHAHVHAHAHAHAHANAHAHAGRL